MGCSLAVGEDFSDCPNHVDGARPNVSTALEIVGSRPMPSTPSSLPPTSSVFRPSWHAQSFPSHSVYRSHLPTLLPAHNTVVNANSTRRNVLPFGSSPQAVPFLGTAPRMPTITSKFVQPSQTGFNTTQLQVPSSFPVIQPSHLSLIHSPARHPFVFNAGQASSLTTAAAKTEITPAITNTDIRRCGAFNRERGGRRMLTASIAWKSINTATEWKLETRQSDQILFESEYMASYLTVRIRLFMIFTMQRLNLELDI